MNPMLVKFAVELQNSAKIKKEETSIIVRLQNSIERFLNFFMQPAEVTIPVEND